MSDELRFPETATFGELVAIIKQAYDSGQRPVKVACQNPNLPYAIVSDAPYDLNAGRLGGGIFGIVAIPGERCVGLGRAMFDVMAAADLPKVSLTVERDTSRVEGTEYSSFLVYIPESVESNP